MRTTIDLPEELFRAVKIRAAEQGLSLKTLMTGFIEAGLRDAEAKDRGRKTKGDEIEAETLK